jgi:hypothetical protein
MSTNGLFPPELMMAHVIAAIVATLIVHIAFAGAVVFDTVRTAMVPRWVWALATP